MVKCGGVADKLVSSLFFFPLSFPLFFFLSICYFKRLRFEFDIPHDAPEGSSVSKVSRTLDRCILRVSPSVYVISLTDVSKGGGSLFECSMSVCTVSFKIRVHSILYLNFPCPLHNNSPMTWMSLTSPFPVFQPGICMLVPVHAKVL